MMNVAIYARVSSDTQAKEGTINSQIDALRQEAQAKGLNILHECLDDGVSGTTLERPGLDHLRELSSEGLIEGVLILSPDRLSRKQVHLLLLMEEFSKRNIQVVFTNQKFDNTPEGNFMLQIQGAVSELEKAKMLDRLRRGMKYAVEKKGQVIGSNTPYGYRFVRKTETTPAHWEVDPREAEIVRLVFDLYVNKNLKGVEIARFLEIEGMQSRSSANIWWGSSIYAILKNETYLGTAYMFKRKAIKPKNHPKLKKYRKRKNSGKKERPREDWIGIPVTPLIDQKTWDTAQRLLKKNANRARRNNIKNQYLLRSLVVCGECGSMASGYVSNRKTYYSCGAKRNKNITTKPHDVVISVRHKHLDQNVWAGLVDLLNNPDNLRAQLEKSLERKSTPNGVEYPNNKKLDIDLENLDMQEQRVLDAYREGIINIDDLKKQKKLISTKRKALEVKRKTPQSHLESSGQPEITLAMLGDVSKRFSRAVEIASFDKRQKLVDLLINSVTLFSDKAIVKGNIPVVRGDVLSLATNRLPFFD